VYSYFDGVTEAADPDAEMFGVSLLREALAVRQDAPLDHLLRTVLESIQSFVHGADKQTTSRCCWSAAEPPPSPLRPEHSHESNRALGRNQVKHPLQQ